MKKIFFMFVLPMMLMIMRKLINVIVIAILIGINFISYAQNEKESGKSIATRNELLQYYSPYIVQELDCTEFGDYITRIDYDGDFIGNNNWENLAYCTDLDCNGNWDTCTKLRPLPAYVYGSVMETDTHYFICYALFHPTDDFHCHTFTHENDVEAIMLMVFKDGTTYGRLRMVQLKAHTEFYQYRAPGEEGIYNKNDDIDGTIQIDYQNGIHPIVYVEGGGHGIQPESMGEDYVYYRYTGQAQDPDDVPSGDVGYDILSTFEEMWLKNRKNCGGAGHLFEQCTTPKWMEGEYVYHTEGDIQWWELEGEYVYYNDIGLTFDVDNCSDGFMYKGRASAPWNLSDDDDYFAPVGEWFMLPSIYHKGQFGFEESVSDHYIYNPFLPLLHSELCGEIYDTIPYQLTSHIRSPYTIMCDVTIPSGQTLSIDPGVEIRFSPGTKLTVNGSVNINGDAGTVTFVSSVDPNKKITISSGGQLRASNGGVIKFE